MPEDNIDADKANRAMLNIAKARLEAAAIYLVSAIKQNISIPSRTVRFRDGKGGKRVKVLGARGSNRSKPGEFVHADYGRLRASMTWDGPKETADGLVVRVGTPLLIGRFIELGTRFMRPRKMLRATLKEEQEAIRQIVEHGERSQISVKD